MQVLGHAGLGFGVARARIRMLVKTYLVESQEGRSPLTSLEAEGIAWTSPLAQEAPHSLFRTESKAAQFTAPCSRLLSGVYNIIPTY